MFFIRIQILFLKNKSTKSIRFEIAASLRNGAWVGNGTEGLPVPTVEYLQWIYLRGGSQTLLQQYQYIPQWLVYFNITPV